MAGLDRPSTPCSAKKVSKTWMPGTRPDMTWREVSAPKRKLFRRDRRIARRFVQPAQIRQAEVDHLHRLLGGERCALAALQEHRGQRAKRFAADAAAAAVAQVDAAPGAVQCRAG